MSRVQPLIVVCLLAAATGFAFSAVSTADFVAHLDRQVHGIHCSFLPGLSAADTTGESGCHATMMSPYSSVFRSAIWGGIPVALPGMAVFAFLAFGAGWLALRGRALDPRATSWFFLATIVPLATSMVMGYLSFAQLDAACKLCIGIYGSSAVLSLAALILWLKARSQGQTEMGWGGVMTGVALGIACVSISVGAYAAAAPNFSNYIGSCGRIPHTESEAGVLLPWGPQRGRPQMVEVFDPLCPSCRALEERLSIMPEREEVDRQLLLFPLDQSCNWMIDRSIHPGACAVSQAILCSADPAPVIDWAFEHQREILEASEADPSAAAKMAGARFPALASCIGSPDAEAKLNQSLRWAVKNRLPILTPQVFVEGMRLCGEDTDLGLDYALPRLIASARTQPGQRNFGASEVDSDAAAAPADSPAQRPASEKRPTSTRKPDSVPAAPDEAEPLDSGEETPAPADAESPDGEETAESESRRRELAEQFKSMQEASGPAPGNPAKKSTEQETPAAAETIDQP